MLKYQFPAVKGKQAGKEYYICMVPLGLLGKIFLSDNNDVAPEHRAQRKLNELRVPEIRDYILDNRDSYVFSALAASVDGEMDFVPSSPGANTGLLEIDMDALFLINDGQHRKAAIEAAGLRLRPILMTSFAFIIGCLPLAMATGAGAAARNGMGVAVVGGMLFATGIAIFIIPAFYVMTEYISRTLGIRKTEKKKTSTDYM